jgi:hypothetical protein
LLQHLRHLGPDILADDPALVGMTVLADLGVAQVILDRYKMPGGEERTVTEALAEAVFAGQTPRYEDARLTVFTVDAPAQPAAYLALGPLHWGALVEEAGRRYRTVGDGPAEVRLHHVAGARQVRLTYRSTEAAQAAGAAGAVWPLDPAPQGGSVILPLPAGMDAFTLVSPMGELQVEEIALLP